MGHTEYMETHRGDCKYYTEYATPKVICSLFVGRRQTRNTKKLIMIQEKKGKKHSY